MASYTQKMVRKSTYWSGHGKHAKIDPALIRREWKRQPSGPVYGSIAELMAASRKH